MLTDGKESRFEDWLLLMGQKLAANADHFDAPQLHMVYITSCCKGKARKHITPCMQGDAMNPYTDSKGMLDHLKTIYSDPNRVTTAKHQCRQLYIKVGDKFHDFLNSCTLPLMQVSLKTIGMDELHHKLTTEPQKPCISDSINQELSDLPMP